MHTYIFDGGLVSYCLRICILLVKFVLCSYKTTNNYKKYTFFKQFIHHTHRRGGYICEPVMQINILDYRVYQLFGLINMNHEFI